jgi:hypothetical protein
MRMEILYSARSTSEYTALQTELDTLRIRKPRWARRVSNLRPSSLSMAGGLSAL